jgi:hypothetical protein
MKSLVAASTLCLCLIGAAAWLAATPVAAAEYTIDCADGTKRTCSGSACQGNDDGEDASVRGYCECKTAGVAPDIKYCPVRQDDDPWDDGGIAPILP